MSETSQGTGPEALPPDSALIARLAPADEGISVSGSLANTPATPVAVATDVGAWRVLSPVLHELQRRQTPCRIMLAEPCATIAAQDGVLHARLTAATPVERAETVLATRPSALLLGTSVQAVAERALTLQARGRVPTLAVLDAMLFVERRFGDRLAELPDLVACPDQATADRLLQGGAPAAALAVTGNPTLEEIARQSFPALPGIQPDQPTDILFVSSPVGSMRLRGAYFAIDEGEALADIMAALAALRDLSPAGFRVRVRLHPVQRADQWPEPPPGVVLATDPDPDRLRSCARARIVVGLSSTLLGEARLLPRAAIAYLPGPFWEQERVFGPEYGVRLASNPAALHAMLREALQEPPAPPPVAGHLGAAGRIAALLETLIPRRA
ncbi:MAG: hypothetical protein AB7P40_04935 [Chloroflexota bacterium]